MKSLSSFGLLATIVAVMVSTGVAFAGQGSLELSASQCEIVSVDATVRAYAKITPSGGPLDLGTFTGQANESIPDGTGFFEVETNTALDLTFDFQISHAQSGTPLTTYLKVWKNPSWLTQPDDAFVDAPQGFTNAQGAKTTKNYHVTIKAKTGAISDQAAGNYEGSITLTVSES